VSVPEHPQAARAADPGRGEAAQEQHVAEDRGPQLLLEVRAGHLEIDRLRPEEAVPSAAQQGDGAVEALLVGVVVVVEVVLVRGEFDVEAQPVVLREPEIARAEEIAPRFPLAQRVARDRAVEPQPPRPEGLPVAALERQRLGRDEGCQEQIPALVDGDEVGQLDAEAEPVGAREARREEPGRALERGIGQAQIGQVEDGHAHHLEARILEIDLSLELIVDDPAGADLPQRHRRGRADLAGGGDDLGKLGVAPAHPVDLGRRELELPVEHQPGRAQQPLAQVARQRARIGEDDDILALAQRDGPVDPERAGLGVVDDAARGQPRLALQRLDGARGDEPALGVDLHPVGHEGGGLGLLRPRVRPGDHAEGQRERERPAPHPSSRCSRSPSESRIAATGGAQAASGTGICPVSPRICAKLRMK